MWCRTPPLSTSLMNCHRAPSSGCAVSYDARKSLYNLLEDHPGCSAPSLGPGGLGLQRLGLCYRTDLFCHSCPQVDGARTHSHPHRTAERWCYGTTELRNSRHMDEHTGHSWGCTIFSPRLWTLTYKPNIQMKPEKLFLPGMNRTSPGSSTHS